MLMEVALVPSPDILLQDTNHLSALRAQHAAEVTPHHCLDCALCDSQDRVARFSKSEVVYLATVWECCEFFSESSAYEI